MISPIKNPSIWSESEAGSHGKSEACQSGDREGIRSDDDFASTGFSFDYTRRFPSSVHLPSLTVASSRLTNLVDQVTQETCNSPTAQKLASLEQEALTD